MWWRKKAISRSLFEQGRDINQRLISGRMAVSIVDLLEKV
jgi:hypothetical protein